MTGTIRKAVLPVGGLGWFAEVVVPERDYTARVATATWWKPQTTEP